MWIGGGRWRRRRPERPRLPGETTAEGRGQATAPTAVASGALVSRRAHLAGLGGAAALALAALSGAGAGAADRARRRPGGDHRLERHGRRHDRHRRREGQRGGVPLVRVRAGRGLQRGQRHHAALRALQVGRRRPAGRLPAGRRRGGGQPRAADLLRPPAGGAGAAGGRLRRVAGQGRGRGREAAGGPLRRARGGPHHRAARRRRPVRVHQLQHAPGARRLAPDAARDGAVLRPRGWRPCGPCCSPPTAHALDWGAYNADPRTWGAPRNPDGTVRAGSGQRAPASPAGRPRSGRPARRR